MANPTIPILAPGTVVMRDTLPGFIQTRALTLENNFSILNVAPAFPTTSEFFFGATGSTMFAARFGSTRRAIGAQPMLVMGDVGGTTSISLEEYSAITPLDKEQDPLIRNKMFDAAEQQKVFEVCGAVLGDMEIVGAAGFWATGQWTSQTTALTNGFQNTGVDPVAVIQNEVTTLTNAGVNPALISLVMTRNALTWVANNPLYQARYISVGEARAVSNNAIINKLVALLGIRDIRIVSSLQSVSNRDAAAPTFTNAWSNDRLMVTVINDDPTDIVSPQLGKTIIKTDVAANELDAGVGLGAISQALRCVIHDEDSSIRTYKAIGKAAFYRHPAAVNVTRFVTGVANA